MNDWDHYNHQQCKAGSEAHNPLDERLHTMHACAPAYRPSWQGAHQWKPGQGKPTSVVNRPGPGASAAAVPAARDSFARRRRRATTSTAPATRAMSVTAPHGTAAATTTTVRLFESSLLSCGGALLGGARGAQLIDLQSTCRAERDHVVDVMALSM